MKTKAISATVRAASDIPTPIPAFAPVDSPSSEEASAGAPDVDVAEGGVPTKVDRDGVDPPDSDDPVGMGVASALRSDTSLCCHRTTTPWP
jgi:hypothetical protein